jgi:hypothetical protein
MTAMTERSRLLAILIGRDGSSKTRQMAWGASRPSSQGNRVNFLRGDEGEEEFVVPGCGFSLEAH